MTSQLASPGSRTPMARLTAATVVGNAIEFYDFNVYGTLTAVVFGRLFFSADDPVLGTFLAFTTFAVGFLARPIGGIVFGHFGDRIGRKPMLVASLLTMGIATMLMGLLPTYAQVGALAPVLLVLLRFVQGLGIGGEWGGAITLMMESAPERRRGIFGSAVQTGSGLGIMLSTGVVTLLFVLLTPEQIDAWGWRIPLLFSVVLVAVGLIIRSKIEESPAFREREAVAAPPKVPVLETLRKHWRMVLVAIGMYISVAAFGFTQGVFFVSYLVNQMQIAPATATLANLVAAAGYLLATLLGGWLSDRIGRTRAYLVGAVLILIAPFLMFGIGATGSVPLILAVMPVVGALGGVAYGAQAALFFELFPARVRYTGISLGFQIAAVLGGGLTPLIAASLTEATGTTTSVSIYLGALTALMIVCTLLAPRVIRAEARRSPAADGDASTRQLSQGSAV
ncbi:MFS transporter [Agromyces mediolanus]|uniref:Putative proline/betaine transporter n=1 Tax=Agromyces mediolanus TaxID=41986 RepID=A0A918CKV5_AGRME|nr:MFS transporter [Agromyces mediolanus]GGR30598.1 MFS transporter [Agromyces mediolanus]GLJ72379.1 MFS transporter [Agromyces mediolanus]